MFLMARAAVFMSRNVQIALQVTAPKGLVNAVLIAMTASHSTRLEHVCKISYSVPTVILLAIPLTLASAPSASLATF